MVDPNQPLTIKLGTWNMHIGGIDNTLQDIDITISIKDDIYVSVAVIDHFPKTAEIKDAIDHYLNTEKANGRLGNYSYFGMKLKEDIGKKLQGLYKMLHPTIPSAIPKFAPQPIKTVSSSGILIADGEQLTIELMSSIAESLKDKFHCKTLQSASLNNEYILVWHNGFYQKNLDGVLRTEIKKILGNRYAKKHFDSILNHMKAMEDPIPHILFKQRPDTTNLENGILDYSGDCKVFDYDCGDGIVFIERKTPDDFYEYNFDYKIPIRFDPKAICPIIDKVMQDILVDKDDSAPDPSKFLKLGIIYQYLGSLLMGVLETKQVPVLLSRPHCGKSTLLNICRQFAGETNTCSVSVQDMAGQFTGASLDGAVANIVDEIVNVDAKTIDKFKGMVAGSPTEIEHKGKDRYTIVPKAHMIMAGNKTFPMKIDVKMDFMSRIVCVELVNRFVTKAGRNFRLKDKIYSPEELSGLLNRAISHLAMLRNNACEFIHDASQDYDIWNKYEREINEAEIYIQQRLEFVEEPHNMLSKDEVYADYIKWYSDTRQLEEYILSEHELSHSINLYFGNGVKTVYIDDRDETISSGKRIRNANWKHLMFKDINAPKIIAAEKADTSHLILPSKIEIKKDEVEGMF